MNKKLTALQIEDNKKLFIEELTKIQREGIQELTHFLVNSDFFIAPASTRFHGAFDGGLCKHCLNVLFRLRELVGMQTSNVIPDESIIITALLHDLDKVNRYEKYSKNVKIYGPTGSRTDEQGAFDWKAITAFKHVDMPPFVFGTHGQNSERIAGDYIPLTVEESAAIVNHSSVYDNPQLNSSQIFNYHPLATLLHLADMYATFIDERIVD